MWESTGGIAYDLPRPADLPANTPDWELRPNHSALLVHDMQHYFIERFAPGRSPVRELVSNVVQVVESARAAGIPVFFTAQPGDMTQDQRGLLRAFWGEGMSSRIEHRGILDEIAPEPDETVVTKWRYSAFIGNQLAELLDSADIGQLVICGVYAKIGILATALESYSRDIETFVVWDGIADFAAERHAAALADIASCCGVLVSADEVSRRFSRPLVGAEQ